MPNSPFSFEMLGSEIDHFLSNLGTYASEYLSVANASAGEFKTTLKNVVPRMAGDFAVDLTENETSFIITCELPGVEKKNISIILLDPTTIIIKTSATKVNATKAKKASSKPSAEEVATLEEANAGKETYHLHEIKDQSRERTVILPSKATCKGSKATFKNGILELILTKATPDKGIAIKIE